MKKSIRFLTLVMVLALSLSCVANASYSDEAAPCTNNHIQSVVASATKSGNTVYVSFTVYGTGIMTSIGASRIDLYTSGGSFVKTFYSSAYATMLGSNRSAYTSTVSYPGTSGKTYYAVVTAYAANGNGYGTETITTGTITL